MISTLQYWHCQTRGNRVHAVCRATLLTATMPWQLMEHSTDTSVHAPTHDVLCSAGTGKTSTLVEAAAQVNRAARRWRHRSDTHSV